MDGEKAKREKTDCKQSSWPCLPLVTQALLFLFRPFLRRVKFFKKNVALIEKYLDKGAIIHIFQYHNYLEYLILVFFLRRSGLPAPFFPEEGLIARIMRKIAAIFSANARNRKRKPVGSIEQGEQYMLFLQKGGGSFLSVRAESKIEEIRAFLELQKAQETPIYLMPHITIWSQYPVQRSKSYWDTFFGNSMNPGAIRRIIIFLRLFRTAYVRSGQPLRLTDWTSDSFQEHGKDPVVEIRRRLFDYFVKERVAVTGPMTTPRTWLLESVLNAQAVKEAIRETAEITGQNEKEVREKAAKYLDHMAADYKFTFIRLMGALLSATIPRLYTPIEIDHEGFERIREQLKKSTVVYVPSHKSHLDYLMVSYLLVRANIFPPHIIAGENLSFWPMGFLFRRMGAIFIKRSFKGNKLYATALNQYLTRLLWEGYAQEFFIEGTRSRTGKLLLPRFGILSIYADAHLKGKLDELTFVPISITYSKLIEEKSHTEELAGAKKKKESTGSLFKLLRIFRLRYGGMYLKVGEPISMKDYVANHQFNPSAPASEQRKKLIEDLGFELIFRIGQASVVPPSSVVSLALLAGSRRGVTKRQFDRGANIVLRHLKHLNAPLSPQFNEGAWAQKVLQGFLEEDRVRVHDVGQEEVFVLNYQKRHAIDYYKNNILHHFVLSGIVATAFIAFKNRSVAFDELKKRSAYLAGFFRFEVAHSPDETFSEAYGKTLQDLETLGYIEIGRSSGEVERVAPMDTITTTAETERVFRLYSNLLANFLESYWLVAVSLTHLIDKQESEKLFLKRLMDEGKKMELIGELERGEAYSKTNFQNALLYFQHRGILIRIDEFEDTTVSVMPEEPKARDKKIRKMKKKRQRLLELAHEYNSKEAIDRLAREIRSYITAGTGHVLND